MCLDKQKQREKFKPRINWTTTSTLFSGQQQEFFTYVELTEKKLLNVTQIFRLWYVGSAVE